VVVAFALAEVSVKGYEGAELGVSARFEVNVA